MLQSIWDDVRREFSFGNMINRIIIVNVAVFLAINIIHVILKLIYGVANPTPPAYYQFFHFIAGSHDWLHSLTRPWTLITHMFVHEGFFHLLWNMLYLFWFGRIFGDLLGDRRVLPLYILGGLAGFLAYFLAYNLTDLGEGVSYIVGASGSIFAILVAAGIFAPDYSIRLFLIGSIRLKYIVFFAIMVQVIGLGQMPNIGGTFDHIGGIIMGFLFAFYLKRGTDLTVPVGNVISWIQDTWHNLMKPSKEHKKAGPRAAYRSGKSVKETTPKSRPSFMRKAGGKASKGSPKSDSAPTPELSHQEELDAILDKIKERGYNSLTKEEKDFLFRASNKK